MIKLDLRKLTWAGLLLAIVFGAFDWWRHRPLQQAPGVLVTELPQQKLIKQAQPWVYQDYFIKPLAEYQLQARVIGREPYSFDSTSDISPVDLALGWGPMSDSALLDQIDFSQSSRWLSWRYQALTFPAVEIQKNLANVHIIPANEDVKRALKRIRPGHVADFKGYLVEVRPIESGGGVWASSLSREGSGSGACEIMWLEQLSIL